MTNYVYVKSYTSQKTIILRIVDALIQSLLLLATFVMISGFLYMIH